MEVILNKDVDKIGKAGAVVKVKDGYARNFLIPNGLALPMTASNLKILEQERQRKEYDTKKKQKESEDLKSRLESLSLTISALTKEEDKLFGSVTSQDIIESLKEEGFEIDKRFVVLDEPIKALGIYEIPVKLPSDVTAKIKVWIVKK